MAMEILHKMDQPSMESAHFTMALWKMGILIVDALCKETNVNNALKAIPYPVQTGVLSYHKTV